MAELTLADIQGCILSGYGHLNYSIILFLQIGNPQQAKAWVGHMSGALTTAVPWLKGADGRKIKPETAINLAFSADGLRALGIPLDGFSEEFCQGMVAPPLRSQRLGDTGMSDPANWEVGGTRTPPIHALLLLYAKDSLTLETLRTHQTENLRGFGLRVVYSQETYRPEHNIEPFGFRDGIAQPHIEGVDKPDPSRQPMSKAGEFILGYRNEYDLLPPMPDLGLNGSYLVYRQMEQDVVGFWNFVYAEAQHDPALAEWLAAKMVGRWRSGAPLSLAPLRDDPALGRDYRRNNSFLYGEADRDGLTCPVGSHVRRSNPRDSLPPNADESFHDVRKHRLIRRGRIYGAAYPEDVLRHLHKVADTHGSSVFIADSTEPRGIAQILINADIQRQFEFVQQTWINDPTFEGLYDNKDPIIGDNGAQDGHSYTMTIPRRPIRKQVRNIPRFVTIRGGGYFFLPGIAGVQAIATAPAA